MRTKRASAALPPINMHEHLLSPDCLRFSSAVTELWCEVEGVEPQIVLQTKQMVNSHRPSTLRSSPRRKALVVTPVFSAALAYDGVCNLECLGFILNGVESAVRWIYGIVYG